MTEFADVYRLHAQLVRRILSRLLPASDVDDGVQEVFLKIHRALPGFRGEASLPSWVYRISINTAQDMQRRRPKAGASLHDIADQKPAVEHHEVLHQCMNQLSFRDRSLLVLYYWEEQKVEEMARHLEIPEGTVKSRLSAARQRLQSLLEKEGERL